mmetsp:Transcript_12763/g.35684  ORF Transcript_12763/g.35684 Transcript_12763/m.35684 type:complete len:251 (-) Transcript_12763:49-801(-)
MSLLIRSTSLSRPLQVSFSLLSLLCRNEVSFARELYCRCMFSRVSCKALVFGLSPSLLRAALARTTTAFRAKELMSAPLAPSPDSGPSRPAASLRRSPVSPPPPPSTAAAARPGPSAIESAPAPVPSCPSPARPARGSGPWIVQSALSLSLARFLGFLFALTSVMDSLTLSRSSEVSTSTSSVAITRSIFWAVSAVLTRGPSNPGAPTALGPGGGGPTPPPDRRCPFSSPTPTSPAPCMLPESPPNVPQP